MKSLKQSSVFLISFAILLNVAVLANNVIWGNIGQNDRHLATDTVAKPSSWLYKQTATIVFPPQGHTNVATITGIRVTDHGGRKDFAYIELVKGGPNYRDATIKLKSQRSKSLNVTIEYYGH